MPSLTLPAAHGKTLALILCGICMTLSAIPAQAEVYRCKDKNGAVIYQEIPCPSAGEAVRLQTGEPSATDQESAIERARRERAVIDNIEAEHDNNKNLAQQELEKAQAEKAEQKAEQKARCEGYLAEAERLENAVTDRADKNNAGYYDRNSRKHIYPNTGTSARDQRDLDQARNLRDRYFMECSRKY